MSMTNQKKEGWPIINGFWRTVTPILGIGVLCFVATSSVRANAATCLDVAKLKYRTSQIVSATDINGKFEAPFNGTALAQDGISPSTVNLVTDVPFCRLEVDIRPSADSFIMTEIWLPARWNGKLVELSTGKAFGAIDYGGLVKAVSQGFAAVSSDSGHRSSRLDFGWAAGHPEKVADYFYRADYESALVARASIKALYGRNPSYSYFEGGARGGEAGLMMAARHPLLFDGIYAASPGTDVAHQHVNYVWTALVNSNPDTSIPLTKFTMINNAVVDQCDDLDGVHDHQVTDPMTCHFDPASIQCKTGDQNNCLTEGQVATLKRILAGPVDSKTGEKLYDAGPSLESMRYWGAVYVNGAPYLAQQVLGSFVFPNSPWNWKVFDFHRDTERVVASMKDFGDSGSDLREFGKHGKIIITHGWEDPIYSPIQTLNYLERTRIKSGENLDSFIKTFLAPGMGHVGGGDGPNTFDPLGPLVDWVEKGIAPEKIIATKYLNDDPSKGVLRTRPLCPYPEKEHYLGSGDINDQASFECK